MIESPRYTALRVLPQIQAQTSAEVSVQWAKDRLKECEAEHERCLLPDSTPLPTRVIHISSSMAEPSPPSVRLYESKKNEVARYACLSHCWGTDGSNRLQTLSSNLQKHKEGIPWSAIP